MTPDYKNFLKFISTNDLASKMRSFDFDSVSDYALEKLKSYINNPNFKPEYIIKVSHVSSILCNWCIYVYEICSIKSTVCIFDIKLIITLFNDIIKKYIILRLEFSQKPTITM
jgi:hypothetical protein